MIDPISAAVMTRSQVKSPCEVVGAKLMVSRSAFDNLWKHYCRWRTKYIHSRKDILSILEAIPRKFSPRVRVPNGRNDLLWALPDRTVKIWGYNRVGLSFRQLLRHPLPMGKPGEGPAGKLDRSVVADP